MQLFYQSVFQSFHVLTVWDLLFFGYKNISAKAACKMLVILITGFHLTNTL